MATATKKTGNGNGALKYVGTRPWRPDGVDKVTGRAKFGADISLPACWWAGCSAAPTRMRASAPSIPPRPARSPA